MAIQIIGGQGLPMPPLHCQNPTTNGYGVGLIDATGEKFAFVGPVWFAERTGTKAIRKVGFRFATVTKAGGSALTVSLQDVVQNNATQPGPPDEVQDQTVAIANANASFVSNAWIQTGAFSADRTVSYGEMLAVVVEYDGAGRLASDAVNISTYVSLYNVNNNYPLLKTGGTWASIATSGYCNIILEFSDGTFGTFYGSQPSSAMSVGAYNVGGAVFDEVAQELQFPFDVMIDGLIGNWGPSGGPGADSEMILYQGTTALRTVVIDGAQMLSTANRYDFYPCAPITLAKNTLYKVGLRPTTANNVSIIIFTVAAAAHMQVMFGGVNCSYNQRVDQGAWSPNNARYVANLGVNAIGFDAGVLINPGMAGGMR